MPRIQYISQGETPQQHLENISEALEAGCKWIQLRLKNVNNDVYLKYATEARLLCNLHDAVFVVNDNITVAQLSEADGVHLGLIDDTVKMARKFLGSNKMVGGTANTIDDVLRRAEEKVNYIGLGPFRYTTTKEKLSPVLGISGYREIMSEMKKRNITIPVFAIGGILTEDCRELADCGVRGIAVSGLITNNENKKETISSIRSIFNKVKVAAK